MNKFLKFLSCLLIAIPLCGCSNKLLETYPKIEEDFNKQDFDALSEMSDDFTLSYDELKEAYANNVIQNSIQDNLSRLEEEEGSIENISSASDENYNIISFDFTETYEGVSNTSNVTCYISKNDNTLSKYTFTYDNYDNFRGIGTHIIEYLEAIDDSHDAYSLFEDLAELDRDGENISIDAKVYRELNGHYYTSEDNLITMYQDYESVPDDFQSHQSYTDDYLRETDKKIEELRDNIEDVEEAYDVMDEAMKESNN